MTLDHIHGIRKKLRKHEMFVRSLFKGNVNFAIGKFEVATANIKLQ